jgi:hypothetical protein
MQQFRHPAQSFLAFLFALALLGSAGSALATDKPEEIQKYTAMLIWGTDGEKPSDPNLKEVDPKLIEYFKKRLKWKNYHEVTRKDFELKMSEPMRVVLSDKCEVQLKLSKEEGLDVELFGEKKSVYKCKQSMPLKDILILAGDDKNATAWFVVLKPRS